MLPVTMLILSRYNVYHVHHLRLAWSHANLHKIQSIAEANGDVINIAAI